MESVGGGADRIFRLSLTSTSIVVLTIMGTVGLFLTLRGAGALKVAGLEFLTKQAWEPDAHNFVDNHATVVWACYQWMGEWYCAGSAGEGA